LARVDPRPYPDMPPSSDLIYEIERSMAAIEAKMEGNLELEEGQVKGAFLKISGVFRDPVRRRPTRQTAYYHVLKEKPLTFQWVPVSGCPAVPPHHLSPWKKADVLYQISTQKMHARRRREEG
jgi:hypothetical protein